MTACEGYNVAGHWVDCDRPMPHAHGIEADVVAYADLPPDGIPTHVAQIPPGGRRCTVQPDPLDEGVVCNLLDEEHLSESELDLGRRLATAVVYIDTVLPTLDPRRAAAARFHLATLRRFLAE